MSRPAADLLLHGGTVRAGDLTTTTTAVAVRAGRVCALGQAAVAAAGCGTEVVDLEGGTVLPAFGDGHAHPVQGGLELAQAAVAGAADVAEVVAAVRRHAAQDPGDGWVLGGGYDPALAADGVFDARWLDAAVPDRPVMLTSADHHCAWVNSAALRLAGLDADTADPPAGRLPRREDGTPVGTLVEWTAMDLVARHAPAPTAGQRREALRRAGRRFAAAGVAWVQEAACEPGHAATYREVADAGDLAVRMDVALRVEPGSWAQRLPELRAARQALAGHPQVSARTVKIFADGVVEAGTAAMLEPYADGSGRGLPVWQPDELAEAAAALDAAGFRLHVHAIGDAAVRSALDAVEHVTRVNGPADRRPVLTHLQVVHPDDVPRLGALGVVANVEPLWACLDACQLRLTAPRLGEPRTAWQYPFAGIAAAGAVLSTGSDWPVSSLRPMQTLAVAVTRRTPEGDPPQGWLPAQRLSPLAALRAATAGVAHQGFEDGDRGRVVPGARADLVWLDRDPLAIDPMRWPDVTVRGTWSTGRRSYAP